MAICCKGRAFLTFSKTNATKQKSEILWKRPDDLLGGSVYGYHGQ